MTSSSISLRVIQKSDTPYHAGLSFSRREQEENTIRCCHCYNRLMIEWIDAHTHLDSDSLFPQRDEVIARAAAAGVSSVLLVNSECTLESFDRTATVLQEASAIRKWGAFGVHPHQASLYNAEWEAELRRRLTLPGVVALGEIGLD